MTKFNLCAFADEADPSIAGQIQALQENGISNIELRGVDGKNVMDVTLEEMKQLRARFDGEGIRVWSIGSPIGKIEMQDDFNKHCEVFRHGLELAQIAGAGNMRIFSFFMDEGQENHYRNEVIDRMGKLGEIAKDSGIILCHENEKGIYGATPERCLDIHKAVPAIRGVFDPANFVQVGVDTLKAWDMLEPYITYMHIKDADKDMVIVPAGEGIGNVPQLLQRYSAIGGKVVTLEPHLAEFVGLAGLERAGETSTIGNRFGSKREAFDFGVNALKALL